MTCADYACFLADPAPFSTDERVAIIQHAGTCPTCLELAFAKLGAENSRLTVENYYLSHDAHSDLQAAVRERDTYVHQCGVLQDELAALRAELEGLRKADALLTAGLESTCEVSDGYKRESRELRRVAGELYAALQSLAFRHGWIPQGGPCVCDEHVKANAALTSAAPILNSPPGNLKPHS